jgi:cell division protein FtsN
VRWLLAGLSLILFAAIIGLSYSIGVGDAEKGAIPIIRADGNAIKVRPDNPGGRKYPHQDLTIYNSFRSDILEKDVQLKDDMEKPLPLLPSKQVTDTGIDTSMNNNSISDNTSNDNNDDKMQLMTVSEVKTPEKTSENTSEKTDMPENKSEEEIKKIVTQAIPQKPVVSKIAPIQQPPVAQANKAYVQIGAFRSEADALAAFKRAKLKFSELSGANSMIVKADLGSKGVYYRLRVGPFDSKQKSINICSGLQAKGQACLYIGQ